MQKQRENIRKYIAGGVAMFALLAALIAYPVNAQAPTITPWPGPQATATAAAGLQAQAAAQRQQVDALTQQAAALSEQANVNYNAAAQAASDARAALAAQQAGAAGEAIGRAEASINSGKDQIAALNEIIIQLRDLTSIQTGTIITLTTELQQARADKQTVTAAYNAALANQEQSDRSQTLLSILGTFISFVFLALLIVFVRDRLRQRNTPTFRNDVVKDYSINPPTE
jgi:hypothetical protein